MGRCSTSCNGTAVWGCSDSCCSFCARGCATTCTSSCMCAVVRVAAPVLACVAASVLARVAAPVLARVAAPALEAVRLLVRADAEATVPRVANLRALVPVPWVVVVRVLSMVLALAANRPPHLALVAPIHARSSAPMVAIHIVHPRVKNPTSSLLIEVRARAATTVAPMATTHQSTSAATHRVVAKRQHLSWLLPWDYQLTFNIHSSSDTYTSAWPSWPPSFSAPAPMMQHSLP